jgi:hypothetical protein
MLHIVSGQEQTQLSRYSDELPAGRLGFDSPQGQEIFLFSTVFKPALMSHSLGSNGYQS